MATAARQADAEVERDLRTMIGGNFAPDHIGPDAHEAISNRARGDAEHYLAVLVERVVGERPDPEWLAMTHSVAVVEMLRDVAPEASKVAASRLLDPHERALKLAIVKTRDEAQVARLRGRVERLRRLR